MGGNTGTVEGIQYCRGIPSVLWGNLQYCGGITAVHIRGKLRYCGGYLQYCGGCSVQWGITSVQWGDSFSIVGDCLSSVGDNISTVEGIQYSGGRILTSACLVINNDEQISNFFYYDAKFSFKQISCLLRVGLVYSKSNLVSK